MSQKQLRNRLDTLFNHIEDHHLPTLADMPAEKVARLGWSWEADGEARYVSVANEVEEYLGLSPKVFEGQSILTFQVAVPDQEKLKQAFSDHLAGDLTVHFLDAQQMPVAVRLTLLPSGNVGCLHGFAQPLVEGLPTHPKRDQKSKQAKQPVSTNEDDSRPVQSSSFDQITGIASMGGRLEKPRSPWTETGHESLASKQLVAQPKDQHSPAVIAAPVPIGQRESGLLEIIAGDEKRNWSEDDRLLVQEVAIQLGLALENAQLYAAVQDELTERVRAEEEVRKALQVLEVRERYQANVARSVAMLSESGMLVLPDVMSALGEASRASRVLFAQAKEEDTGVFWNELAQWSHPEVAGLLGDRKLQYLRSDRFPGWSSTLRENGWLALSRTETNPVEGQFLQLRGVQSILLLAVPGKSSVPSFLAFEQALEDRHWRSEEIRVLRVAADALSNTLIREDLLDQLQLSLEESEDLYATTHTLSMAGDFQDMIRAVAEGVKVPEINRAELLFLNKNPEGELKNMGVVASWHSQHGTPPAAIGYEYEGKVAHWFSAFESPTFFDDISEANLDPEGSSALFLKKIRSLAVLPLWAGKQRIGVFVLQGDQRHHFTGREIRSYPPLIDQMATGIQNRLLFKQTEASLAETQLLYRISAGIASAASVQDLVDLVAANVMPEEAQRITLQVVSSTPQGQPEWLEIAGVFDRIGTPGQVGKRDSAASFPFLQNISASVLIDDVQQSELDDTSKSHLLAQQIAAICVTPLFSGGKLYGLLSAASDHPAHFKAEGFQLFQVAASGIAIALERQLLLREAQRRAIELQTAAEIARDTSSTLSLGILMKRMVDLLRDRFDFYHASIFMLDETGEFAVIRESTGQAGEDLKRRGHKLAVGSRSIIGKATASGEPFIVNDVTASPTYYPNPLLPRTRSEIGLPLKISGRVIGAVDIQSTEVNAFSESECAVLRTLADQIAVAVENARSYELAQRAVEEMREVDRVKSQFLANMSHELRTPLNSIIGFSRVILKGIDGPVNEIQEQDLTSIYNSGQHLLRLINDILDLSKIEAGKMELQFTDVNISDMINSVLSTGMGLVKDKPIKLQTQIEPGLPIVISADPTRVRQVLLNFISNAAKFTDQGSITVAASQDISPDGRPEILITVTDTGDGIAEQDRVKLFQPFSQVDDSPTRKTGGTGLGLSICRSFIEMHGGRIGLLASEVGKGSTFYFTLPMPIIEPEAGQATPAQPEECILAIDDDMQVIQLYQRYLQPHGYRVIPLTDPHLAVQRAREIQPFAITLDVMMPDQDGWSLIHELKNHPDTRAIPIIICSILEEEEKGFSLGAADYLVKPFLEEDLINALHRLDREGNIKEILIVDDSLEDSRLLEKILEDEGGFHTLTASGGQQALATLAVMRPDAIILDLFMPDLNGFSLLETFRSDPKWRSIPVIVLSGADLTAEQHTMLANFGQLMLTKGMLREKDLLNTLEDALRKMRS